MKLLQCTSNNASHSLVFADFPDLWYVLPRPRRPGCSIEPPHSFKTDGSRIGAGFNTHASKTEYGPVQLPEALLTAFRVTHKGTAFDLTREQAAARAVASGVRALSGHLATCDLRSVRAFSFQSAHARAHA